MNIIVPPEGSRDAEIAIVGEAPGTIEEMQKRPFVGPAGRLLDQMLLEAGILRQTCYITNVMKERPPKNDFSAFWLDRKQTVPTEELKNGVQKLFGELLNLPNLKVIIALGRQPLHILSGQDGISKWRGSILPFEGHRVSILPTFHPSFILRQWAAMPIMLHDLKRAVQVRDGLRPIQRELLPYPTDAQIMQMFEQCRDGRPISVDIECAMDCISRISLAQTSTYAISIPFINLDEKRFLENRGWIWHELKKLLKNAPVIGQNFSFDMTWLYNKQALEVHNLLHDTMIAQHVILPGLPSFLKPLSLAMLTSLYTTEPYYKDEGKVSAGRTPPDEQYGIYSAKDAAVTLEIYEEQRQNSTFQRRRETFEFEMTLIRGPIKQMMRRGVLVDVTYKAELKARAEKELEFLELKVAEIVGEHVNLRSPKQLKELLFTTMNLKGGEKQSTDEDSLKILQAKYHGLELLDYILQHRGIEQVFKNILNAVVDTDNRMRCSYSPTTNTGRFKSSKNPMGTGTNLQNVPRDPTIRRMFLPDPENYMIEFDLEQAELRVVAYESQEPNLIYLLETAGTDVHAEMAMAILGKTEITKAERQLGKRTVHAGNYLISGRGLVRACRVELGLDLKERDAKAFLTAYFHRFPRIKTWHREIENTLRSNRRTLITPLGRERIFFERWGSELFRKATAFLPQSTIADLLNHIMLKWLELKTVGELMMQLHDAIYVQVPKEQVQLALKELREAFHSPFQIHGRDVIIPAAFKISECWGGDEIPCANLGRKETDGNPDKK